MNTYHFCYFIDIEKPLLSSVNINAESIKKALEVFEEKYPKATISYIHFKN